MGSGSLSAGDYPAMIPRQLKFHGTLNLYVPPLLRIERSNGISISTSYMKGGNFVRKRIFFPENLKFLRKSRKMSQIDLAECFTITRGTISTYENGIAVPDIYRIIEIADYFGISIDSLIFDDLSNEFKENSNDFHTLFRRKIKRNSQIPQH